MDVGKRPVEIEDITRLSFVSNPLISPGGEHIAYLVTKADVKNNRYRSSLWLASQDYYKPLTSGPSDRCPEWSPDGVLIAFSRTTPNEGRGRPKHGIYITSVSGGEPWALVELPFPPARLSWSPDGGAIGFLYRAPRDEESWKPYEERDVLEIERIPLWFNGEGWVFDRFARLVVVSYPGGEKIVEKAVDGNIVDFSFSPDGSSIAYAVSDDMLRPYEHRVVVWDLASGEERVVWEKASIASIAWDLKGRFIALRANERKRGLFSHFQVYIYDTNSDEIECLTCHLDRNVMNTVNSDSRGPTCLKGLYWDEGGHIYFPVHNAGRIVVSRAKPGGEVEEVLSLDSETVDDFSVSRDGDAIAYVKMGPTLPPDVYLLRDGEEFRLTEHNRWFTDSRKLAEPIHTKVESPHGGSIDAWILLPPDKPDCTSCVPWILYIHGGPKTSYGYAFIHEFQTLASKGFAVIYSNPRGSDGYSEAFADLKGKYGDVDYDELMKVVDEALSNFPELDPGRGGVTGGSYGGYMTNTIVTKTTRFRAAVTQRSCSEWIGFYGESDIGWYFAPELLGADTPWRSLEKYVKFSPLFKAENIKTPLLIIHSTHDFRCPVSGAIELFTALKVLGVETRLAIFPGETHDLSRSGSPRRRVARLREITSWFEKHLKTRAEG